MDTYSLLKTLYALAIPPASLAVALVLGLVLSLFGWRRSAAWLVALAIAQLLVMSFPPVGNGLMKYLEDQGRAAELASPRCCFDAIVVLGGGIAPGMIEDKKLPHLVNGSDRIWLAARLYRDKVAPQIIVAGGGYAARRGVAVETEAAAMRRFLVDLGVPNDAIVDEDKSVNTIENIRNVRGIVGKKRVALITSAYHMPRAMQLAALAGLNAAAFATDYRSSSETKFFWEDWIFSSDALDFSIMALRELVAQRLDVRARAALAE
jgi:uncharacterized SAM-binding protein YcdF (DUF218 family)